MSDKKELTLEKRFDNFVEWFDTYKGPIEKFLKRWLGIFLIIFALVVVGFISLWALPVWVFYGLFGGWGVAAYGGIVITLVITTLTYMDEQP